MVYFKIIIRKYKNPPAHLKADLNNLLFYQIDTLFSGATYIPSSSVMSKAS